MEFKVFDLGLVDFKEAWHLQKEVFNEVKQSRLNYALILCRHYPVVTLGRRADKRNILVPEEELRQRNIGICQIERGGDITYHGPGQITAYPIFNLNYLKKDIHWFLRRLEDAIINFLSEYGIKGQRQIGLTGVWVAGKKIASIGIAIRNWITFHGLSINIARDDLTNFGLIRPCGMDIEMTALEAVLNRELKLDTLKQSLIQHFKGILLNEPAVFSI